MQRLLAYSHDTYGLGNLRRMLSLCQYLSDALSELTILLISGSPMAHSFRLPRRLDYIKLPCLTRTEREGYAVKSLDLEIAEIIKLRSDLTLSATANFQPALVLVDKKPYGVKNELEAALKYLKERLPWTKQVLILRDILDAPEATIQVWQKNGYYDAIQSFYDLVFVLGMPEIFDPRQEYRFPDAVAEKVRFCGYLQRSPGERSRDEIRKELRLSDQDHLVLLTAGGGEDGYDLMATYLEGVSWIPPTYKVYSLIICGPEMKDSQRQKLSEAASVYAEVRILEFTDDLMSYMDAADVVISMGGYNTVCEILSLKKKAIVVPRVEPVPEQWIRAERMSQLGLFKVIHPDALTPDKLICALLHELEAEPSRAVSYPHLDLGAHSKITYWISSLLADASRGSGVRGRGQGSGKKSPAPDPRPLTPN